jgi:hypothetical protein
MGGVGSTLSDRRRPAAGRYIDPIIVTVAF